MDVTSMAWVASGTSDFRNPGAMATCMVFAPAVWSCATWPIDVTDWYTEAGMVTIPETGQAKHITSVTNR